MKFYIGNAFSLGMVPVEHLDKVRFNQTFRPDFAIECLNKGSSNVVSCVGHADTAAVLGVPMNRVSVTLQPGDVLYVAQLRGGRLPEGTTTLPEGFGFDWVRVEVAGVLHHAEQLINQEV